MRIFSEIQKFDQWWLRLILGIVSVIIIISIVMSFNKATMLDSLEFWMTLSISVFSLCLIIAIAFQLKLYTKIDEQGIHYGFWPFHNNLNLAKWGDMEKCYVRKYKPLMEYGGWGYRVSLSKDSKAYNVKGNIGIQILFKSGKKVLIGTLMGEDAQSVISRYQNLEI